MQIQRRYELTLSTGSYLFFVRTVRGGAQFVLFDQNNAMVAGGTLDFEGGPNPVLCRSISDNEALPYPKEEIEAWMRTWPPEERLLIDVLSLEHNETEDQEATS